MKNVKLLILYFFILILSGCDTEGENTYAGYTSFMVKIEWQADADVDYKMTFDNDTIKQNTGIIVPREQTSGILRVYRNDETTPELEKEITIENNEIISLVQMPASSISVSTEETDPSTAHHVKVRLFYKGIEGWGSSVKIDIYATVDRVTYTSTGVSAVLEEGELSSYFELDLNQFFPTSTSQVYFNSDITDVATGTLLVDHSKGTNYGAIQFGTTSLDATNGWKSTNKCATSQMKKQGSSLFRFLLAFGTPWE